MRRLSVLVLALALLAAACGDDDAATTTTPTTGVTTTTTAETSTTAPASTSTTVGSTTSATTDTGGPVDHDSDDVTPWEGTAAPGVAATVTGDADGGWVLTVEVSGMDLVDPDGTEPVPGQGHLHVYLDGEFLRSTHDPIVDLGVLDPGPHTVAVALADTFHREYVVGDVVVDVVTTFTAADPQAADVVVTLTVSDGAVTGVERRVEASLGDEVEIVVTSDVADEVHVHVYDLHLDVLPGEPASLRFVADIPGIVEVELEDAGLELFELAVS
ncbi:MAG: hypothetical protein R3290_02750 [Acidimicrobiia bacterium]|nr:hypothetical protein [Acidimicrobiia bacterium]